MYFEIISSRESLSANGFPLCVFVLENSFHMWKTIGSDFNRVFKNIKV